MALLAFLTVGFLLYLEHKSGELGNTEKTPRSAQGVNEGLDSPWGGRLRVEMDPPWRSSEI